jgi:hypothetical protein
MIHTVEAMIDSQGRVQLLEEVKIDAPRRALVTILDEPPEWPDETALLSEPALAEGWLRPEEDAAWAYLQSVK